MITFVAVLVGILYANIVEYLVHKHLFHGLGKKASSIFAFHLRGHHLVSRRDGFVDMRISKNEFFGMPIAVLFHSPLLFLSPVFFWTITSYAVLFIAIHNMLHKKPRLAKKYFWWHWNHHMGNQNKSWGVVLPITDLLMGTLEKNKQ